MVANASRAIDDLIKREPPASDVRGHHFYWPKAVNVPSLIALLTTSPAWSLAESLTGPRVWPGTHLTHGGNISGRVRRAVYFRVKRRGHDRRWREFLQDPWLDYDGVRTVLV
ncbi:MAG: hypothetical protein ACRDS0_02510 [Pseudonocardiaceae bacterium]